MTTDWTRATMSNLIEAGLLSAGQAGVLRDHVGSGGKLILVGPMGSGKTTLAHSLAREVATRKPLRALLFEELAISGPMAEVTVWRSGERKAFEEIRADVVERQISSPRCLLVEEVPKMMSWHQWCLLSNSSGGITTLQTGARAEQDLRELLWERLASDEQLLFIIGSNKVSRAEPILIAELKREEGRNKVDACWRLEFARGYTASDRAPFNEWLLTPV